MDKSTVDLSRINNDDNEIIQSAIRVYQEAATFSEPHAIYHDGTKMVLIPEVIFNRLKEAIENSEYSEHKHG